MSRTAFASKRPLSQRVVEAVARRLDRPRQAGEPHTGGVAPAEEGGPTRRGFLAGTAVVGSALAVAPARFLLHPVSAYAAATGICGPDASCVTGGFSVFCCTINNGVNQCPSGSIPGGWWRAGTGSSWCCGNDRYYIDCQATCPPGCGCGSGPFCPGCQACTSGCYSGSSCDQRNVCRIQFRYGQCNQQVGCTGNVLCRMVSCTPPWAIAGLNCAASPDLADTLTAEQSAPCLQQASWQGGAFPITNITTNNSALAQERGSGRADLFSTSAGHVVWSPNTGGGWGAWRSLGAPPVGFFNFPGAESAGPGNLGVLVRGKDNNIWHRASSDYGSTWSAWAQTFGNSPLVASAPAVCSQTPGAIDLFVIGVDGNCYHRWYRATAGGWNTTGWENRGAPPTAFQYGSLTCASWGPNRVDVFGTAGGTLWQTWWDGAWHPWSQSQSLGSLQITSAPAAASWGSNQLAVFAQGNDGGLWWNNWFQGYWSGWARVGVPSDVFVGTPAAGSSGCQELNVLVRGTAGHIREYLYLG